MTKTLKSNTLTKSLVSGAAAIGVLAGVGIAAAPAQAVNLGFADLEWEGETDNWLNEALAGGPISINFTTIDDYNGSGSLANVQPPNPFAVPFNSPDITLNLTPTGGGGYTSTNDLVFDFDNPAGTPVAGAPLTWTIPTGTRFLVETVPTAGEGRLNLLDTALPYFTYDGQDQRGFPSTRSSTFTFSTVAGDPTGGYEAVTIQTSKVPEPASILGLLAVGGLGLGLKRKKQS